MKNIQLLLFLFIISTLLLGCTILHRAPNKIDLNGTTWIYSDKNWTYEIKFLSNGKLQTTHPNDITPDNDYWTHTGNTIKFDYNDGYSEYTAVVHSMKKIKGKGKNVYGVWNWEMKRKK